jgi:hypothetical protein
MIFTVKENGDTIFFFFASAFVMIFKQEIGTHLCVCVLCFSVQILIECFDKVLRRWRSTWGFSTMCVCVARGDI